MSLTPPQRYETLAPRRCPSNSVRWTPDKSDPPRSEGIYPYPTPLTPQFTGGSRLKDTTDSLDPGRAVLATALDLLNRPRDLYNTATDHTRKLLNKAIFTRLYLDTDNPEHHPAVTTDDLNEPFASLVHAVQTTNPARPPRNTQNAPHGPTTHLSGLLASALAGQSASKAAMVDLTLQHTNQILLVEGPEIMVRPVGTRRVTGGPG